MKANTAYAPEIDLSAYSYIPKRQPASKAMRLKRLSEKPKSTSGSVYRLSAGEQSGCDMATD